MENTKYGRRREGRWTPIWAKTQDTKANPNSWETHLVRKRWDIGLLRALGLWIMMMMILPQRQVITSLWQRVGSFVLLRPAHARVLPDLRGFFLDNVTATLGMIR